MDVPEVSVIMPIRAPSPWLMQAVNSVFQQSCTDLELICVLDGFDEFVFRELSSLEDVRIIINEKSKGPAFARRRAMLSAHGKWVAPLDADDVWPKDFLNATLAVLRRRPELALVGVNAQYIDENGAAMQSNAKPTGDRTKHLILRNQFVNSGTVFRRSFALACGSYNPMVRVCEDYDLWLRLATQGKMLLTSDAPSVSYRKISDGVSTEAISAFSQRAVGRSRTALAQHLGVSPLWANLAQFAWQTHMTIKGMTNHPLLSSIR